MALNKILDGKGQIANGIRAMPRFSQADVVGELAGTTGLVPIN
jgi:hypothetical protein